MTTSSKTKDDPKKVCPKCHVGGMKWIAKSAYKTKKSHWKCTRCDYKVVLDD